ncbi:MAG: relaxase/mobilization nuclease domain-containing protein [Reichenbachiella sp.]|uniref:relaxase/mobilization nuclease domain-containing protein n=1 Tax=Reichenbachiella sp. TaxID=2184521 RepID=UPI003297B973
MWIVVNKPTSNISGLLDYDKDKEINPHDKIYDTNLPSTDPELVAKVFEHLKEISSKRVKSHYMVGVLSLAKNENLDNDQMCEIVKDYLSSINLKNFPYTISIHDDTDHKHAHFIASRIDFDGQSQLNKKVFYKKEAKTISNKWNTKHSFNIIDNDELSTHTIPYSSQEINISRYNFHNAILKAHTNKDLSISDDLKSKLKTTHSDHSSSLEPLIEKELGDILKLKSYLSSKSYFNTHFKKNLIDQLNLLYDETTDSRNFLRAINSSDNLYARIISDKQKDHSNKVISYGIKIGGKFKYFDQKSLPLKFHLANLNNKTGIQENNLKLYSFGQQRAVLKRILFNAKKSSKSVESFFQILKADKSIKLELHYSGDNLNGYKISLTGAADPYDFKASQIHRDLTINSLNKAFSEDFTPSTSKTPLSGKKTSKKQTQGPAGSKPSSLVPSNSGFKSNTKKSTDEDDEFDEEEFKRKHKRSN